jgi:phospholipid/cholesterol/gamma-HCH transport system substrate-binding protein
MDERVLRFRVGVVVLAAAVITSVLIMLLGEGSAIFQRRYTVFLRFPQAPGVTVDTPVRKHGILVGRVSDVKLLDEGGVLLTAWVDNRYTVRRNEVCRISTSSLLGDAVLEFVPRSSEPLASREPIRDGDLLADGLVASDPLKVLMNLEGNVQGTIDAMETAANEVAQLARNLNNTLSSDQGQFQRIISKSELALDALQKTMLTVDEVLGDPELKEGLKRSLRDLPAVFQEVRSTMTQAQKTLAGFEEISQKAGRNLDNLEELTRPLGERGEALVENVNNTLTNLDQLLAQLVDFSKAMNSSEGTLGRLVHDRDIYEQLQRTAGNLEGASRKIRPILDDVRVFTDKIATDPRQLGVKGALDKKPLGLGLK